jgi:hypothetical protein
MRMIEHHRLLYRDLADPVALLRGKGEATGLGAFWPYAKGQGKGERKEGGQSVTAYSTLMAESLSLVVDDVLEAFPFAGHRQMFDVGGGTGRFALAEIHVDLDDTILVGPSGRTICAALDAHKFAHSAAPTAVTFSARAPSCATSTSSTSPRAPGRSRASLTLCPAGWAGATPRLPSGQRSSCMAGARA